MQRIQAGDADLSLYLDKAPQAVIRQYVTRIIQPCTPPTVVQLILLRLMPPQAKSRSDGITICASVRRSRWSHNSVNLVQGTGGKNCRPATGTNYYQYCLGNERFDPYATPDNKGSAEKAKALLTEAGLPDGVTFDLVYRANNQFSTLAVILKEDLAKAGININLIPIPAPQFMAHLQSPENRWDLA